MYKYICSFCISRRLTVNFFPETFLFPISSFVFASVATARVWYLWNKQQKFSVHMWYWPSSMGWILAEFFCQSWAGKMDPSSCLGLANQNERFTLYHPWVLPAIMFNKWSCSGAFSRHFSWINSDSWWFTIRHHSNFWNKLIKIKSILGSTQHIHEYKSHLHSNEHCLSSGENKACTGLKMYHLYDTGAVLYWANKPLGAGDYIGSY